MEKCSHRPRGSILKLAWSPDGKYLASASADRTIKLFRAADLTEVRAIANQPDWPFGLAFSPDGKSLAAGLFNGTAGDLRGRSCEKVLAAK
jgi:WD40 repeat protein